jgi:hypothetical protein
MRRVAIVLVVVCLACLGSGPALGQKKPKPLPAEVVAAWQKAGAEVGWLGPDEDGELRFRVGSTPAVPRSPPALRFPTDLFARRSSAGPNPCAD